MRYFGSRAVPMNPVIPDTRLALLLTANSGQAFDYPTGTDLIRITVGSTITSIGGPVSIQLESTGAALPTTGAIVTTSLTSGGILMNVGEGPRMYQRPRGSTGFSLIAGSSYSVGIEFWSRAG